MRETEKGVKKSPSKEHLRNLLNMPSSIPMLSEYIFVTGNYLLKNGGQLPDTNSDQFAYNKDGLRAFCDPPEIRLRPKKLVNQKLYRPVTGYFNQEKKIELRDKPNNF